MKTAITKFLSILVLASTLISTTALAQTVTEITDDTSAQVPEKIDVEPTAADSAIDERLTRIIRATKWFDASDIMVRDGVVFLDGQTGKTRHKEWAGDLARRTQDVVAVVNRVEVVPTPKWDFTPALQEITLIWRSVIQAVPLLVFALIVLPLAWMASRLIARLSLYWLEHRVASPLLASVLARVISIPFFLLGLYIVLQVSGLTRLALTLVGGTGVAGIIFGFAFRDIAENFLASLLLSMRRPFQADDFIEVAGHQGLVREMNTRSTVLMTRNGNHVQVPNATIFKSTIVNMTANPNSRAEFLVGIGYENSIREAQDIIGDVMRGHSAVLKKPEPLILVDELGSSSVNLRAYFWFDFTSHSEHKLKSVLLRQTLRKLEAAGITAPDDAREIIFPEGVPLVRSSTSALTDQKTIVPKSAAQVQGDDSVSEHEDEGGLSSDTRTLQEQADHSRSPEAGSNLLED
ncbi:MAG: mechanosensitive ion channel domain-containing protein [Hyphomicrobiaceae bacterium]